MTQTWSLERASRHTQPCRQRSAICEVIFTRAVVPVEVTLIVTPLALTDWAGGLPAVPSDRSRVGLPFFTSWINTVLFGMPRDQPLFSWYSTV